MSINPSDQLKALANREVTILSNHCMGLVIKDEDEANSAETEKSLKAASDYLNVYYQTDKYPAHETLKAIIRELDSIDNPDVITAASAVAHPNASSEVRAIVNRTARNDYVSVALVDLDITYQRDQFMSNFVDLNPYYENLKKNHGIPIWKSRQASDFDILLEPKKADDIVLADFYETYTENQRYFFTVVYTKAFTKDMVSQDSSGNYINYYKAFCRMFICFMTIIKCVNKKLKNPLNPESMDEYILDNMLFSFGFTDFRDFPVDYKRKIVLNINELIRHKGTDRIFIDILNIFDFQDINIFKYYIAKHASSNAKKTIESIKEDIRFVAHDVNIPSLQEAIRSGQYTTHSFEDVTDADPYWHATKAEIGRKQFNYVNSKYFSIESSFDMYRETTNVTYLINLVKNLRDNHPNRYDLTLFASKISDQPIDLVNLLVATQVLMSDYYGIDDTINFSQDGMYSVLSYNTDDRSPLNALVTTDQDDLTNPDTQRYVLERASDYSSIEKPELEQIFKRNGERMTNMRNLILSKQYRETDIKSFAKLKELYNSKFLAKYNLREYRGFTRYTDYLRSKDVNVYTYLDTIITSATQEEKRVNILYVLSALTEYSKNLDIRFDNRFSDVITAYINRMVSVFKAYTVTLKDFTIFYSLDESLFFSFFDRVEMTSGSEYSDSMEMGDVMGATVGSMETGSTVQMLDRIGISSGRDLVDAFALHDEAVIHGQSEQDSAVQFDEVIHMPAARMGAGRDKMLFSDRVVIRVIE